VEKYIPREKLERSIKIYRVVLVMAMCLVLFIGMNNISTTEAADHYKAEYEKQKAKADVLEDEIMDIKSGFMQSTCLKRIPAFEA